MKVCQRLSPMALTLISSLLLTTVPDTASGRQVISKVPQASAARQDNNYYGQNGQSDYNYDYSSSIDDYLAPVLNSHSLNRLIDKSFAKYMGGILVVNLLTVAAIALLVWMFVICTLKPGCLVYNWREVGASSRRYRYPREEDEAPLQQLT